MYANQLAFLTDVVRNRPTDTSLVHTNPSSPTNETEPAPTIHHEDSIENVQITKKRKMNTMEIKLMKALDNHNIRQNQKAARETYYEDDDKLFLLSLLPFVKSIPPHFKFAARMDIMQSINKYIIVQPPSLPLQQASYSPNPIGLVQVPDHQSALQQEWQQFRVATPQLGPSEVQHHFSQNPVVHQQEPQPGPSGIQRQRTETPMMSPIGSVYSQDSTDLSLF